jgi:GLPGLI family protein
MKQLIILFVFAIINLHSNSQSVKLDIIVLAQYKYEFMPDSTSKNVFKTEVMNLYISKAGSLYKSSENDLFDSITKNQKAVEFTNGSFRNNPSGQKIKLGSKTEILKKYADKIISQKEYFFGYYLLYDSSSRIEWKILSDTQTVNSFKCQKAEANFKGRKYTAWFCSELPFFDGPWKLSGLPGLIVNAYDSKGEIKFSMINLRNYSPKEKVVSFETSQAQIITKKQLKKLVLAYMEDPSSFVQSNWKTSATTSSGMKVSFPPGYKVKTPNNSIELTE